MRQTRMIRISFLICAVLAVIAFWTGFYFGENRNMPSQILTASGANGTDSAKQLSAGGTAPAADSAGTPDTSGRDENTAGSPDETVESMNGMQESEKYVLRESGEYLTVYHSDTGAVYFETDLRITDLPEELQAEAREGIPFYNMEELYGFLENYSS